MKNESLPLEVLPYLSSDGSLLLKGEGLGMRCFTNNENA
jgi:hypothetical protein